MPWRISRETEDALWSAAKARLPDRAVRRKSLVPAIERRSALYTSDRDELDSPLDARDALDLAARALFFTPADAPKIMVPIAELVHRDALPANRPLRVLDVGAGCGAMTFGLAEALPDIDLEVLAIDRDEDALAIFAAAAASLGRPSLALETAVRSVKAVSEGPFDVIVCGSVLNEVSEKSATALVEKLLLSLSSDGVLIVIEPALRDTSRRLHRLRDRVIEEGLAHVFAPCTRAAAPCPALALERDWCHEDRAFETTPRLAALTAATGMRAHRLKFSYLVLTRQPAQLAPKPGLLRIVSALKKSKGKSELHVCGEQGWSLARLQKRDRTDKNRAFERARRGQLLEVGDGTYVLIDPTRGGED